MPVTVVGSINLDIVHRVERLPRPGETVASLGVQRFMGGKGANQAVAAAWLAPLPPMKRCTPRLATVSPGRGSRSTRWTMSRLIEPTTVTGMGQRLPLHATASMGCGSARR